MTLLHTIYLNAIAAEAASGSLMGMRRRMDLFGLCVVGTVTAQGGGTVRDIILGHYPIGCDIAAGTGAKPVVVNLMGVTTGVCGGLLRDVLCNQVPLVLRRDLYATVSLVAGMLYVGLLHAGVAAGPATATAIGTGFALRLLAIRFALALPVLAADISAFDDGLDERH